jgi:hypothetical protein
MPVPSIDKLPEEDRELLKTLQVEAWRHQVRLRAADKAAAPDWRRTKLGWTDGKPPASQLNAFREAVRSMAAPGKCEWLERLKQVKNRREKWPEDALKRAEELTGDQEWVWRELGAEKFPVIDEARRGELKALLWAEAAAALVETAVRHELRSRG